MFLSRLVCISNRISVISRRRDFISSSQVIQFRLMSSNFTKRMRLQQKFKTMDHLGSSQYLSGIYLIFVREGGLVMISNVKGNLVHASHTGLSNFEPDIPKKAVFVNIDDSENCRFAVEFPSLNEENTKKMESKFNGTFVKLRQSLFLLSAEQSALVSQSRALFQWRRRRNFCPECGSSMEPRSGWSLKMCVKCGTPQYPYTAPVGIALVEDESHTKALLVRQPRHPPGMFSCLAGFVDAGESLEQNMTREVAEEVGLDVCKVQYIASQHWPYPAGRLMLGCIATSLPGEVEIDPEELEDAAWFSPPQLKESLATAALGKVPKDGNIWLPPVGALAHTLIRWWLDQYHK